MGTKSQSKAIAETLKSGKTITSMQAIRQFGCTRLAARILDLRQGGMKISRNMVCKNGKRVAEYFLEQA